MNKMKEKNITKENNPYYIVMRKRQFYGTLIIGFVAMLIGGIIINRNPIIGSGIMGMGLAICLVLLGQYENSIGYRK